MAFFTVRASFEIFEILQEFSHILAQNLTEFHDIP